MVNELTVKYLIKYFLTFGYHTLHIQLPKGKFSYNISLYFIINCFELR